jgi:hypothetical protein
MFPGFRVETVIEDSIGSIERGLTLQGGVTDTYFAVVPNPQLTAYLQRNSGKALVRAHDSILSLILARLGAICSVRMQPEKGRTGRIW